MKQDLIYPPFINNSCGISSEEQYCIDIKKFLYYYLTTTINFDLGGKTFLTFLKEGHQAFVSLVTSLNRWTYLGFRYNYDKHKFKIHIFPKINKKDKSKKLKNNKLKNIQIKKTFDFLLKTNDYLLKHRVKDNNMIRGVTIPIRYLIFQRDNFTCRICNIKGQRNNGNAILHIDHIIPIIYGGSNDIQNLQTLCRECNIKKKISI